MKKKQILNKVMYMKIRNMKFLEMENFLEGLYTEGFKEGEADGITNKEVYEVLKSIKGIGEKRAQQVMDALGAKLDEEYHQEYTCGNCGADLTRYKEAEYCPKCGASLGRWWEIE